MAPVPVKYDCLYSLPDSYLPKTTNEKSEMANKNREEEMKTVLRNAEAVCFDVDSTVLQEEAIDELANFCGMGEAVERVTAKAMNGGLCYRTALGERLGIMKPSVEDIAAYVRENPPKLTDGVRELISLLQSRGTHVYLVSGGFESVIIPIAEMLHIPTQNIYANRLLFFHNGGYAGFDKEQPTSESGGKKLVAQQLKSKFGYKNMVFIGDGMTDLETYPTADGFIGFGGNVVRDKVKAGSPWFVHSFDELINVVRQQ